MPAHEGALSPSWSWEKGMEELKSFTYCGVDYQIEAVVEIGKMRYQIKTKDGRYFEIQYNDNIFKWVITEGHSPDRRH
jgi:hypothetical protein